MNELGARDSMTTIQNSPPKDNLVLDNIRNFILQKVRLNGKTRDF